MLLSSPYDIGERVFLITDTDQNPFMITRITISPTGNYYCLSQGTRESWHYDIEFTRDRNVVIASGGTYPIV